MADEGYIYEPRALWEVFFQDNAAATFRLQSTKENWMNGSRYPITLSHMLVSPLNYPTTDFSGDEAASQINAMQWTIGVRGAHYSSRQFIRSTLIAANPVSDPRMRYSGTAYSSGLLGVSRWTFDKLYTLPRRGSIRFDISEWTPESVEPNPIDNEPQLSMLWYEIGDWMLGGHARLLPREQMTEINGVAWPEGPGVLSVSTPKAATPGVFWQHIFSPTAFVQQEATRGAPATGVQGFAVLVDQIGKDDSQAATFPGQIFTPFSQRVITRCKTANGGTGEWWWRPGAPLCLVTPTLGSALVYRLPEPIVLGPGDQLELEVEVPATETVGATFHAGFSFCGYATVEG